jgi:hypothetical protein
LFMGVTGTDAFLLSTAFCWHVAVVQSSWTKAIYTKWHTTHWNSLQGKKPGCYVVCCVRIFTSLLLALTTWYSDRMGHLW